MAGVWSESLQALAAYVAHDLRNALNAVAVNMEVVRSRSARGAEASAIAPFATTAAAQLEVTSAATEALLAFVRPEPQPADVATIVGRLARLLAVHGRPVLTTSAALPPRAQTSAPADLVRAVVARSVLSAVKTSGSAPCEIRVADGIFLRVTGGDATAPALEPELAAVASAYGVAAERRGHTIELSFPPLAMDVPPPVSA